MNIRESSVEKGIKEFAKSVGITMEKQNGPGNRGKADQRAEKNGKCGFLEIKRPGETPRKLQLRYLQQKRDNGFPATWVDNIEDGIQWLKENFL